MAVRMVLDSQSMVLRMVVGDTERSVMAVVRFELECHSGFVELLKQREYFEDQPSAKTRRNNGPAATNDCRPRRGIRDGL